MKKLILLMVGILIVLTGCTSSGVLQIGPDTYTVGTTSELSPAYAKKLAMQEAMDYCKAQGKEIMPMQTQTGSHRDAFGDNLATYDYTFKCLSPGDPQLGRPEFQNPTVDINLNQKTQTNIQKNEESDLYTELMKLNELKEEGIITEEEFQVEKKELLRKY